MVQEMSIKYRGVESAKRRKEKSLDRADTDRPEERGKEFVFVHKTPKVDPKLLAKFIRPRAANRRIEVIREKARRNAAERRAAKLEIVA